MVPAGGLAAGGRPAPGDGGVVDAAGNAGAPEPPLLLVIDTAAPAAPAGADAGPFGRRRDAGDGRRTRPLLSAGRGRARRHGRALRHGLRRGASSVTRSLGFASYDAASGTWSLRVGAPLADGPHLVTARVVDAAGNAGAPRALRSSW